MSQAEGDDGHDERALRNEKDDSMYCLNHDEPVFSVAVSPFVEVRVVK